MSDEKEIKFFSEVDMTTLAKGGRTIGSKYPSWYFDFILDDVEDAIRMDENAFENRALTAREKTVIRERLERNKGRKESILAGKPDVTDVDKDKIAKVRKELGKKITENMFTRNQMAKGLADAHTEAKRMSQPIIPLSPDEQRLAAACNIKVNDGKVSRTRAEEIWKICSKFLGEMSNTESLRRD